MTRPTRATIHLSALRNNLALARRVAPGARVLAVIKANAYGHGLLRAADALQSADGFALVELDAAVQLRDSAYRGRIVLLEGFFEANELAHFAQHRLTSVVHHVDQVMMLEQGAAAAPIDVFVKLNTGMNRLGLRLESLRGVLERLRACANVGDITLMTHFACADDEKGVQWQLENFQRATAGIDLPTSMANSATLLRYPELAQQWLRPGIMLYGASPFPDRSAHDIGLEPAMTFASRIIATQDLARGDTVGYGSDFTASGPLRIGIVACGYADGYPRHAPTGTPIVVEGRRTRTVGRVSMDMLSVDLTGLPDAGVGADVLMWGGALPVEEVARAAGTISYELLCALAARVPVAGID